MGRIGRGYGSEWELMRYLARHRHVLDCAVGEATKCEVVDWLDFPWGSDADRFCLDEHRGLDFLFREEDGNACKLRKAWEDFWPKSGSYQSWDALGWLRNGHRMELLLVEAKSHENELNSKCGAGECSLKKIRKAMEETKAALEAATIDTEKWLEPYYQYCNRLATLHFLRKHCIPTRLVFIYFTGDKVPGQYCPPSKCDWNPVLERVYDHIGVDWDVQEKNGVHKVFLPVTLSSPT